MNYKLLLVFIYILIYFFADNVLAQSERTFKGNVKKYTFYNYGPSQSYQPANWQFKLEGTYDTNGREINSGFWSKTKGIVTLIDSNYTYYDEKGRRVKIIRTTPPDTAIVTYIFNTQNNLEETYYASARKGPTFKIVYNKKSNTDTLYQGKLTPTTITRHLTKNTDEEITYYPELAFMATKEGQTRPDTSPVPHKSVITYNNDRNKIEEKRYTPSGQLEHHLIFAYNKYGNCIEVKDSVWRKDKGSISHKMKFDIVSVQKYLYKKIDKAGNWGEQYTLIDGKFLLTARREFEYHP